MNGQYVSLYIVTVTLYDQEYKINWLRRLPDVQFAQII